MTEQEIMQLVEEAGMFALIGPSSHLLDHEIVCLQRFANLVAERERKACADMYDCEELLAPIGHSLWGEGYQEGWIDATCAYRDIIRYRGEKESNYG